MTHLKTNDLTTIAAADTAAAGDEDLHLLAKAVNRLQIIAGHAETIADKAGYSVSNSFTRPSNTTAYTAGDAVGATNAILTITDIGPGTDLGRPIMLTSAALEIDVTAVPSGMTGFRLHLYNASPDAKADNDAWDLSSAGDRGKYLGYIDLPTPTDLGSTLWSQEDGINKQVLLAPGVATLFGIIQTLTAWTPASATVFNLRLHSVVL